MPLDITATSRGYSGTWVRVPAGPVLAIAPFNFPLNLVAHKLAPALACGCSVVLKPPPQTPLTSRAARRVHPQRGRARRRGSGRAVRRAGRREAREGRSLRDALVHRKREASAGTSRPSAARSACCSSSAETPRSSCTTTRRSSGRCERVVSGAFGYAGQVCIKVQRLYLHRPIADSFVARLVERTRAIEPKSPLDPNTVCGPDDRRGQREARRAVGRRGACAPARACSAAARRDGNRYWPTVLEIRRRRARASRSSTRRSSAPCSPCTATTRGTTRSGWPTRSRYGLQAGVFTDSRARVAEAFARLHVGGLVVNDVPTFRVDSMPYGGVRDSGLGREGVRFAIEEMTERKLLVVRRGG